MSDGTTIEWTHVPGYWQATWNPIRARNLQTGGVGHWCSKLSGGCANCYAERIQPRFRNPVRYAAQDRAKVELFLDHDVLLRPLRTKKPTCYFAGSMTDLFHLEHPDEWIDQVFSVAALCREHLFIVPTKRSDRMRAYRNSETLIPWKGATIGPRNSERLWPNVWLGVSVEDQETANERIPHLLATPAAVRFISYEPALGPVDFRPWLGRLDWIIAGGESGPGARPTHQQWFRSARDQCTAAQVAFFLKQWGEWAPHKPIPGGDLGGDVRAGRVMIVHPTGQTDVEVSIATGGRSTIPGSRYMARVGKHRAGHLLDGREWREFPTPATQEKRA